jgi:hypothetical protein
VAAGSVLVVIISAAGLIAMLSGLVAVAPELSCTRTVKLAFPAADGVPEITPAALKLSPAGSDPPLTDHVYPPVPPLAASACE